MDWKVKQNGEFYIILEGRSAHNQLAKVSAAVH